MKLRWEQQSPGSYWAYSGSLVIAMIGKRVDGSVYYSVQAVHTKWICKGHGEVKHLASARRAVERAWRKWLTAAGLVGPA